MKRYWFEWSGTKVFLHDKWNIAVGSFSFISSNLCPDMIISIILFIDFLVQWALAYLLSQLPVRLFTLWNPRFSSCYGTGYQVDFPRRTFSKLISMVTRTNGALFFFIITAVSHFGRSWLSRNIVTFYINIGKIKTFLNHIRLKNSRWNVTDYTC